MQYINVSQFYESILCFAIPLLLIQRVIICCFDLSHQYENYRETFYDSQFRFTREYEYALQDQLPPDPAIKDAILDARDQSDRNDRNGAPDAVAELQRPDDTEVRSRLDSQVRPNFIADDAPLPQLHNNARNSIKVSASLEIDRQLMNSRSVPVLQSSTAAEDNPVAARDQREQINSGSEPENAPTQTEQQPSNEARQQTSESKRASVKEEQPQQRSSLEGGRDSKITIEDIEVRRETQLGRESIEQAHKAESEKPSQKHVIELGTGELQEKGEKDRVRLRFCRRIDDAFNDYVPIILSVVVLGIVSNSVYIYSMCCFFGYAFTSLLFNYANLLDKLEGSSDSTSCFGKSNQLISSLFIIGLFISYWISGQFS